MLSSGLCAGQDEPGQSYSRALEFYQQGQVDLARQNLERLIHLSPEFASAYLLLGKVYASSNLFTEAQEMFSKAIKLEPDSAEAYHSLGVLYLQHKAYEKAEEALTRSVALGFQSPVAFLDLGTVYLNRGQYEAARGMFEKIVESSSTRERSILFAAKFNLALVHRYQEEYSAALRYIRDASELSPGNAEVLFLMSDLYVKSGNPNAATRVTKELLGLASGDPDVYVLLSTSLLDDSRNVQYAGVLEQTLQESKQSFGSLLTLGVVKYNLSRFLEAEQALLQALTRNDRFWLTYYVLGKVYNQLHDRRAIQVLQTGARREPANGRIWKELSDSFSLFDAHDEAVSAFEGLVGRFPASAFPHVLLGEAYFNASLVFKSLAEFQRAAEIDPDLFSANYGLAFVFKYMGRREEAKRFLEKSLLIEPLNVLANLDMGELLVEEGAYDPGISHLRKAADLKPDLADPHFWLGRAYFGKELYAQAEEQLRRAVGLDKGNAQAHYLLAKTYFATGKTALAQAEISTFNDLEKAEAQSRKSTVSVRFN